MFSVSLFWLVKSVFYCVWGIIIYDLAKFSIREEVKKGTIKNLLQSSKYRFLSVLITYLYFTIGTVISAVLLSLFVAPLFFKILILTVIVSLPIVLFKVTAFLLSSEDYS